MLDDETVADILALHAPIRPRRACGAYPVNGLLDVIARGSAAGFDLRLLGRSTSGDDRVVALADKPRPAMHHPDEPVMGHASFALWQER